MTERGTLSNEILIKETIHKCIYHDPRTDSGTMTLRLLSDPHFCFLWFHKPLCTCVRALCGNYKHTLIHYINTDGLIVQKNREMESIVC